MLTKTFFVAFIVICIAFYQSESVMGQSTGISVLPPAISAKENNKDKVSISWQPWSDDVFARAKAENKLVILDLHAVWCHWCHVMDEKTYGDAQVAQLIQKHFIPISVDQDSRPDLSNRYEDYGWPATVIFNSSGKECKILSGYMPPDEFLPILRDCTKHPDKVTDAITINTAELSKNTALGENLRQELKRRYVENYDTNNGGWTLGNKFLPADNVEYSMLLSYKGDQTAKQRAKEVLDLQRNLLDPVWGGVYQYSTDDDWQHPHYEKIMSMQTDNMRIYSLAYLLFKDQNYLDMAQKIYNYLNNFLLSPEGAFYTSQDADLIPGQHSDHYFALDDKQRRKLGLPHIDKHIYSRENGWVIEALAYLYTASGNKQYLEKAINCANWIIAERSKDGGFCHEPLNGQIYLGDNVAMAKAFLYIYATTGERTWLKKAEEVADYTSKSFSSPPGFLTTKQASAVGNATNIDENVAAARFFNLLYHYSGRAQDKTCASIAMQYLANRDVAAKRYRLVCGILLADQELNNDPIHLVVAGAKNNEIARQLFITAQKYPLAYKQIEWLDNRDGPLPNQDIEYPSLQEPAVFVCSQGACSAPIYSVEDLNKLIDHSYK